MFGYAHDVLAGLAAVIMQEVGVVGNNVPQHGYRSACLLDTLEEHVF